MTDEEVNKILAANPDLLQFEYSHEEIIKIVEDMRKSSGKEGDVRKSSGNEGDLHVTPYKPLTDEQLEYFFTEHQRNYVRGGKHLRNFSDIEPNTTQTETEEDPPAKPARHPDAASDSVM